MAWNDKELTEGQKKAAEHAGIPASRPGYGAEYPKAVYRADKIGKDRMLLNEPLKVQGQFDVETATVANEEEEAEALSQGWYTTPDLQAAERRRDELADKDAEIARLQAELAGQPNSERRGPGRPPKVA